MRVAEWGRERGFTLVEMLVVVAIISILAGLITVSVQHARGLADVRATRHQISLLAAAAESYRTGFGDHPPTSFAHPSLKIKTNGINEGNESLLAHISTQLKGGPYLPDPSEDRLDNIDNDSLTTKGNSTVRSVLNWTRGNAQLLEYCDLWGNPFVYIHHRDYKSKKRFRYMLETGEIEEIAAAKSVKTGTYLAPTSFQIWSFGPNRMNEGGEGDDVVSWRD